MNELDFDLSLVLLLAHLLGDYLFQTKWMVAKKKKVLWVMALHSLINAAVVYLLLGMWTLWLVPLVVFASHFLIDFARSRLKKDGLGIYLFDQTLHLAVLAALIWFYLVPLGITPYWFEVFPQAAQSAAVYLSAILMLTLAGGVLIGYFVHPFQLQIRDYYKKKGLNEGGKVIGWLERMLIFVFVLAGQYAGVGWFLDRRQVDFPVWGIEGKREPQGSGIYHHRHLCQFFVCLAGEPFGQVDAGDINGEITYSLRLHGYDYSFW